MSDLFTEAKRYRAKKRFSQNFLVDETVVRKIVETMQLDAETPVVEIGPGLGFLTRELLPHAVSVTGIEVEHSMCFELKKKFSTDPKFTLIEGDVLKLDWETQIPKDPKTQVVGNLPYSITTPILFQFCGEVDNPTQAIRQQISRMTLMVQKEVAQRIAADPGNKAYNHLSIAIQTWFDVTYAFTVPKGAFYPAPKVDSAVITMTPRPQPVVAVTDWTLFGQLIKAAFAHRRKTLRNSLLASRFASGDVLDTMFEVTGVPPIGRPETVSIERYGALANAFCELHATHPSKS